MSGPARGALLLAEVRLYLFPDGLIGVSVSSTRAAAHTACCKLTSSLLDCFALLALRLDMPASLALLWVDSNFGRGIAEGLSANGFWPLFLGVPR